jgi:hypothetical protein
MGDSRIKRKE